jgi:dTDP-glucose 4,6-dehydratase
MAQKRIQESGFRGQGSHQFHHRPCILYPESCILTLQRLCTVFDTIFVTGGAGFLGSWFVRHWLGEGRGRVVVLDKLTYAGSRESLAAVDRDAKLVFRQGDIGDPAVVTSLLAEFQPAAIVNFAAETHVDRSIDAPSPFVATNVVGTCQLLDATLEYWRQLTAPEREGFRFLHISTDEVFGPIEAPGFAMEDSPYRPSSPYAASKAAADHFVRSYHRTYGLPTLLVHPSNNYGPFQFPEKLIPIAILNAAESKPLPIYGDGEQTRDWLFGEDLCRAVGQVLKQGNPGESFNVASGVECSNETLVRRICELVDQSQPQPPPQPSADRITHVEDRPGHDRRYALDTARIRSLGWEPRMDLEAGLAETVRWYLDNRAWVGAATEKFDRTRRLGIGK